MTIETMQIEALRLAIARGKHDPEDHPVKMRRKAIVNLLNECGELRDCELEQEAEELSDVVIVCLGYAEFAGIDLEHEIARKLNILEKRVQDGK